MHFSNRWINQAKIQVPTLLNNFFIYSLVYKLFPINLPIKPTLPLTQIIIFLLIPFLGNSQQNASTPFEKLILQQQQTYSKAIEQAQLAFQLAENNKNKKQSAIALNREGLSLIKLSKRVKKNRKEAIKIFKQSLFYLAGIDHQALRIDNLENLKWLALQDKDKQQVALYEKQIAEIKNLFSRPELVFTPVH
ncbi:MAG: hypothetical protein ACI8YQ_000515 [Polaribacter sp.]|jgi:hypothetical protein